MFKELISVKYGGGFNLFHPKEIKPDDEEYVLGVFEKQFKYSGPFPAKITEIADPETSDLSIIKRLASA
jgi:hypothetical protein